MVQSTRYEAAPFGGPFSVNSPLLDSVTAASLPYEGLWVHSKFSKYNSLEIFGVQSTLSVQLYGSNAPDMPVNQYFATVSGSITTSDVLTLTFGNPLLPAGQEVVSYTVQAGDTLTTIAAAIAALINADTNLLALGFNATNTAGVVNITFPSITYTNLSGSAISDPQNISSPSSPSYLNFTSLVASKSGGASETFAITNGSNGQTIGSAITALGLTQLTGIARWTKARLNTLTGSGAVISAYLQGVG